MILIWKKQMVILYTEDEHYHQLVFHVAVFHVKTATEHFTLPFTILVLIPTLYFVLMLSSKFRYIV